MEATIRRAEHPRPDRMRAAWRTLNGPWGFAFDRENSGLSGAWHEKEALPLTIEVPFAYQSELSGIAEKAHCDVVWYHRTFEAADIPQAPRVLLHFGAVDYRADVWLDGQYLGGHTGGYTPFSFDVTAHVAKGGTHRLVVRCEDRLDHAQPRGKQSYRPEPFGCWYTPVTGIWQSVWLEGVGAYYLVDIRLTPHIDTASLTCEITLNDVPPDGALRLTASFEGGDVARQEVAIHDRRMRAVLCLTADIPIEGIRLWAPGNPALYDLTVETLSGGKAQDKVDTYFGMREISVQSGRVLLNNSLLYQRLVLDQGYWPDGLLTAPSDDALRRDVELTLAMGFNGARKHQKLEDPRYLYWADRLGLLVWGEIPSAYWLCDDEKRSLMRDLGEAIARDYNHPSVIVWVPLNESWGVPNIRAQGEAQRLNDALYAMAKCLDGTRLVSGNDGWELAGTDLVTLHDYAAWPDDLRPEYQSAEQLLKGSSNGGRMALASGYDHTGKPLLMTEYGGIAMAKDSQGENWGYNGAAADVDAFLTRYEAITRAFVNMPYFCGYCYTQLTDVFQEVNGLLDMHREPKAPVEEIRRINQTR